MKEMQTAPAPRRWTRKEYERMIGAGVIHSGERVELLDGEIVTMAAQGNAHVKAVHLAIAAFQVAFGHGYWVRSQAPLALDDHSAPEPDVAVVPGAIRDYEGPPTHVLLAVEVSDTTLRQDRQGKGSLYARGGVQDYWIVNLPKRLLEVYREPVEDPKARYGWKYRLVQRFGPEDQVRPLARPDAQILVADLLP